VKVVVIGGTGLIGSKVVKKLGEHGHEAVVADLTTGVNTLIGEGLAEAGVNHHVARAVVGTERMADNGPQARYFGGALKGRSLMPSGGAQLGTIRYRDWLSQSGAAKRAGS
jgi:NAD(P)-dependent dehydrogenase (short-subunit alcohol dehydrogenase family)